MASKISASSGSGWPSRNAVIVEPDGRIRVALTAPPVEGAANDVAERIDVDRLLIEIPGALRDCPARAGAFAMAGRDNDLRAGPFGEDAEECVYLWKNVFDPKSRLLEMNLTFFVPNGAGTYERFNETHVQRAHAADDLCETLEACGFTVQGVYDAFTRNASSAANERIQFAARRNG